MMHLWVNARPTVLRNFLYGSFISASVLASSIAWADSPLARIDGDMSEELMEQLQGCIWEKRIDKQVYSDYEQHFNIIFSRLSEGNPIIHVFSEDNPGEGFISIKPKLDDVYFTSIDIPRRPSKAA